MKGSFTSSTPSHFLPFLLSFFLFASPFTFAFHIMGFLEVTFCDLFGYGDKAEAYQLMDQDVCFHTHPDDVARIYEAIRRFISESGRYEVIFRARKHHENTYRMRRASTPTNQCLPNSSRP